MERRVSTVHMLTNGFSFIAGATAFIGEGRLVQRKAASSSRKRFPPEGGGKHLMQNVIGQGRK